MKTHRTDGKPTRRYMRALLRRQDLEQRRERFKAEFAAFQAKGRDYPSDTNQWTLADAKAAADRIRALDAIFHRNGFCTKDRDCLSCDAMLGAAA